MKKSRRNSLVVCLPRKEILEQYNERKQEIKADRDINKKKKTKKEKHKKKVRSTYKLKIYE